MTRRTVEFGGLGSRYYGATVTISEDFITIETKDYDDKEGGMGSTYTIQDEELEEFKDAFREVFDDD